MRRQSLEIAVLVLIAVLIDSRGVWAGDISGSVVIKSPIRKRAVGTVRKAPHFGGYGYDVPRPAPPEDETRYVVVYVDRVDPSKFTIPAGRPKMIQESKEFKPHILPVVAGQVVDFPNLDKIYHNVYSESAGNKFELPEYAGGASREREFKNPGIVELFCGIHTAMNAYIVVLQNPFFSQPDANHAYSISGLPAGKYVVRAWHPQVDSVSKTIDVPDKGTVKLDFEM